MLRSPAVLLVLLLATGIGQDPAGAASGAERRAALGSPQEVPVRGRLLFLRHCRGCHGSGSAEPEAPELRGLFEPEDGGGLGEDSVRAVILDGRGAMTGFRDRITEAQLDDLLAYLRTR